MFIELLKRLAHALDKNKIPYMVIGGQAVLFYGEPRLTKDIDITLGVELDELPRIERIIKALKLIPAVADVSQFVNETMVFPVLDKQSGIRVDLIFSFSAYEKQAIQRAEVKKFGRTGVKIASLEDVVIHKVIAGRARDIEDVKIMLMKNPDYDLDYVKRWLSEFDKSLDENFRERFEDIIRSLPS